MREKYKNNLKILLANRGKSVYEIDSLFPSDSNRRNILSNKKDKGRFGKWFEWIILGEKGDTKSKPDLGYIELKTRTVGNSDNISITSLNFKEIGKEFKQSALSHKLKMLFGCFTRDGILNDIRMLDLTKHKDEVERVYNMCQDMVMKGLTLSASRTVTDSYIVFKTANRTNTKQTYVDNNGTTRTYKKRNFGFTSSKFSEMSEDYKI